jgi:Na+/proline symporter
LDWSILLGYLLLVAVIGVWVGRKVSGTHQYFLGERRFGKWLMIGQSFSQGTHPEMIVSLAGAVFTTGASAIWYQWKNLFATPFYWIMAPVFRRIRRATIAELVQDRYGPWMAGVYILFALCFFTINTAGLLKGAAKVINQAVGGQVGVNQIVLIMTCIFILYAFVGGLISTAWTEFLQGFLIITLSFMLIPLGWPLVGGMEGLRHSLDPHRLSIVTPAGIGPWVILMLTLNGLIGIMAQPHMLAAVGTGRSEHACRVGFFYGNFVKRFCTVGWAMMGLIVAGLVSSGVFGDAALADPEDAFGLACRRLLFPGLLGLLIACVLAASMGASSAFMVDGGALFTQGFYRRYLARDRSDRHYLWVGRVSGFSITMGGVLYALFLIKRVLYSFLLTETMATFMGISIVGGILWKRANRWGAAASLVAAFATNFLLYWLRDQRMDHWDADVFCISLTTGTLALVVVSLLTRPEPAVEMDSFFSRLQTATDAPDSTAPKQERLLLADLLRVRQAAGGRGVLSTYRTDLAGLGMGFLLVLGLVFATWLLFKL